MDMFYRRASFALALTALFTVAVHGQASAESGAGTEVKTEILLGKNLSARILDRHPRFEHDVLDEYVNRVGQKIAAHAGRPEIRFTFTILDTDALGSYAAPAGFVFITRGALNHFTDEAELAGVLAHEVGHVIQRHLFTQLLPLVDTRFGIGTVQSSVSSARLNSVATAQATDKGMDLLFRSGLAKAQEFEADRTGTRLLERAGYNPAALRNHLAHFEARIGASVETPHALPHLLRERVAHLDTLLSAQRPTVANGRGLQGFVPVASIARDF